MTVADDKEIPDTDLVSVVNRTATIENILNQVIENYFSPRKELKIFFWDVLLDSSVMALGSKVKVAMAIAQKQASLSIRMPYITSFL